MNGERFRRFAWFFVAYNLVVIVWGAYVRASGSGAGCGSHWPLCNGEVVPRAPSAETLIELSHRLTSGLALVGSIVLVVWAFRLFRSGHPCRRAAVAGLLLMLVEAAVGAGLVLFGLVADNDSVARAIYMAIHLINTFLLLGALTLTADLASAAVRDDAPRGTRPSPWPLMVALGGLLLVGASGAVAALGDTLFPATDLGAAMRRDFSPTAHWLERLRVLHPLAAAILGAYLLFGIRGEQKTLAGKPRETRWVGLMTALVVVQMGAGLLNIQLLAPIWLQLIHLLLADLLWIVVVLLASERLGWGRGRLA